MKVSGLLILLVCHDTMILLFVVEREILSDFFPPSLSLGVRRCLIAEGTYYLFIWRGNVMS
jgi:hypothetical protein